MEAKLAGSEAAIKAYSIAVDVFGRPASFDPQSDPIVRVQARRLRAALDSYYADTTPTKVRIYLPTGGYIPEFEGVAAEPPRQAAHTSAQREARGRAPMAAWLSEAGVIVALVVVGLGIAVLATNVLRSPQGRLEPPRPPRLVVSDFVSVQPDEVVAPVGGLVVELVTDLGLFGNIDIDYLVGGADAAMDGNPYLLKGIVRTDGELVRTTASLRETDVDTALWTHTVTVPLAEAGRSIDDISREFAQQLGSRRGPLHRRANEVLAALPGVGGQETEYVCELLFGRARDTQARADELRAADCLNGLLFRSPDSAVGLAMSAAMTTERLIHELPPGPDNPALWTEVESQLARAIRGAPTSSFVWELHAHYFEARGRMAEAENAYLSARQLNPANLDMLAAYGRLLVLAGPSSDGMALAQAALAGELAPPPWYRAALAVDALRAGNNAQAMVQAGLLEGADTELASVIAATAARRQNAETALNRALAQLLEVTRFKRFGILPVLRQRIRDEALVTVIADTLRMAGVTEEQLSRGSTE